MQEEIKEILKVDKQLLDKIEYILSSELNCEEYDRFYNYFNEIRKPNILIDIKDDENIKDYITNLQEENERLNNIIDKAIERIEKELNYTPSSTRKEVGLILVDYKKLLNILKGDNK